MKIVLSALFVILLSFVTGSGQGTETKCPVVSISGPAGLTLPGDTMFFRVEVAGMDSKQIVNYEWNVTKGTITNGQGTNQITVQSTADDAGSNITATVIIKGLPEKCPISASEVVGIANRLDCGLPADEYGHIEWSEEQARLDSVIITLLHNPKGTAFFHIYIGQGMSEENVRKHIIKILKHVKWREENFDLGRLKFGIDKTRRDYSVVIRLVSEGAEMPTCGEGCTLLDGKHIYF